MPWPRQHRRRVATRRHLRHHPCQRWNHVVARLHRRHLSSDSQHPCQHFLLSTLPREKLHPFLPPFPTIAMASPLQISCSYNKNPLLFDHYRPAEPDQPVPPCRPFRSRNPACQNGISRSWPEGFRGPLLSPPHWRNARSSHDKCLPGAGPLPPLATSAQTLQPLLPWLLPPPSASDQRS